MLKPDGWLVMEIGYNIDREVRKLFNQGWRVEPTRMDQSGIPRVIAAEKIPGLHGKDNCITLDA
jgi:methylase of polypeptide subunit release factors